MRNASCMGVVLVTHHGGIIRRYIYICLNILRVMVMVGDDDGIIIVTIIISELGRRWFNKNVYEMYYKYFVSVDHTLQQPLIRRPTITHYRKNILNSKILHFHNANIITTQINFLFREKK